MGGLFFLLVIGFIVVAILLPVLAALLENSTMSLPTLLMAL